MKVIDPGHIYKLDTLDGDVDVTLTFVKREGEGYPGNIGHHAGTNIQEVLRALIDRVKYLNSQIEHPRNWMVEISLREALNQLELRAAERHGRTLSFPVSESMPTCGFCGHVGCDGHCH